MNAASQPGGLPESERAELERLRAEVAALQSHLAEAPANPKQRGRTILAAILIALGSVLLLPATVATWLDGVLTDSDRYVDTVSPLSEDPAIQRAVTNRVTTEIASRVDVAGIVDQAADALGEQEVPRAAAALDGLAEPIASGFEDWLRDHVAQVVVSDRFKDLWAQAHRAAHERVVALMTGEGDSGAVTVSGDTVTVELGPLAATVKDRLIDAGVGFADGIPEIDAQIEVIQSDSVTTAQGTFRLIDRLGLWLVVIALLLIASGVLVARDRRRALVGAGIGAVLAMVALGVTLAIVRPLYLDALPTDVDREAAAAIFVQLVSFLRTTLRTVLVVGVILGVAGYLTGPSASAASTRGTIRRFGETISRRSWAKSPVAAWGRDHKRFVEIVVVVSGLLVFIFWNYPSAGVVLSMAVIVAVMIVFIEIVAAAHASLHSNPDQVTAGPAVESGESR